MKKILFLIVGFSCSAFALQDNPIAPPSPAVVDRFGVNLHTGQLSRQLNTISIGGELGLSHHVQLYTDLWLEGGYGFVDAFAGKVSSTKISKNVVQVLTDSNGDISAIRDTGTYQPTFTPLRVMRVYGPAGSQDFLVYKNGLVNNDASTTSGYIYKPVGDSRHSLIESADKRILTWTTPSGIESKYERFLNSGTQHAGAGAILKEVIYPNGFKVRVAYKGVSTNTGFMLKYHFDNSALSKIPCQVVGINRANEYCSTDASSCATTGWPTATFTWPTGTPSVFRQPGLPSSRYTIKMTTADGVTDIEYHPENICIKEGGNEDASCAANPLGGTKWYPRLRSIRTPESNVPNYKYTYKNQGAFNGEVMQYRDANDNGMDMDSGFSAAWTYWTLTSTGGQITRATVNGTDSQSYFGPTINTHNANVTWGNGEAWVVSSQYELNVIESVTDKKSGTYIYHKDSRHLVDKYYPLAGLGPAQQYFYNGPRGNLNQIKSIVSPGNPITLQEMEYAPGESCIYPKTCNKPVSVKDARGNITEYEYDPQGRFGSPIKITSPANENGKRPTTVYNYEPMYAYYKRDGEAITQDPDPIWMLTSEHTCRVGETTSTGCVNGVADKVETSYYYGPQNGQANNLLLRGKSITAQGTPSTRVWCYEYDKYGKLIGETAPKGNSTNLQSCQ